MAVAVNSITLLKAPNVFEYNTKLIDCHTLLIAPELLALLAKQQPKIHESLNRSLVWQEENVTIHQKIASRICANLAQTSAPQGHRGGPNRVLIFILQGYGNVGNIGHPYTHFHWSHNHYRLYVTEAAFT